jgi:hypothetical protein
MADLRALQTLCINLSGQSVGDRAFHRHAIDVLTDAGSAVRRCICLEITETAAVTNMADAAIFIEQVRALGAGWRSMTSAPGPVVRLPEGPQGRSAEDRRQLHPRRDRRSAGRRRGTLFR